MGAAGGKDKGVPVKDPDNYPPDGPEEEFETFPGRFPCPKCGTLTEMEWAPVHDPLEQARATGRCPTCGFDIDLRAERVADDDPDETVH